MDRGDTEKQARIRDRLTSRTTSSTEDIYFSIIKAKIRPVTTLLDIGCGTGHIIVQLAPLQQRTFLCGLDISPAMVRIARVRTKEYGNVSILEADGLNLPFADGSFDIVATRLAEFAPAEAYRVLRPCGLFFECGLGPESDKEIREFFSNRIIEENFCLPKHPNRWHDEIAAPVEQTGFAIDEATDHKQYDYYDGIDGVMDLIEMVPLVENFDRDIDRPIVEKLVEKYNTPRGVRITWHYYIIQAHRT
ncbi:MAG: class I SAM-dependent methyltransferase [candidate division WOR-3 bacterium]|nr:MAG: class I SAM-dependent methyltransferase [candidate division WOR-3 bacterium]